MTDINRVLAERVMGWEAGSMSLDENLRDRYVKRTGKPSPLFKHVMYADDWSPTTNLQQAFECMHEFVKSSYRKKKFLAALKDVICEKRGVPNLPYKEIILWMDAESICRAILNVGEQNED